MFLLLSSSVYAGSLNVTMTHGLTGNSYSRHLTFSQRQQYTRANGKVRHRWVRVVSQRTDPDGKIQLQYPDNIGTEDEKGATFLNEFKLSTKSPVSRRNFSSDPFTNTTTQYTFKVGAPVFTVTLSNATTNENIINTAVTALLLKDDGSSRRVAWRKTNGQGKVDFELPDIGSRQYFFKTRAYRLPVFSNMINQGNSFDFKIGTTAVGLVDSKTSQLLSNIKLVAYEKLSDGSFKRFFYGVKTNEDGVAFFDLAELGEKHYIFRARHAFGKDDAGKRIAFDYDVQPVVSQPGYTELVVSRRDDSGDNGGNPDVEEAQKTLHLLNRITFGATPELLAHVNTVGIDAFIEEQLNPESIDDSTLRANVDGWIDAVGDTPEGVFINMNHLSYYTLYQAMYSKRQLQEVMTQFWENHFNTDVSKTRDYANEARENDLLRRHALGKFRDLLAVSAHSPMMLRYLDNSASKKALPNENYAREIMELHTLGVYGGYTENDIVELSKILTGWTYTGTKEDRTFYFKANNHDESDKVFLGESIASNGQKEGELVLDILASSPVTAQYICSKLAKVFVSDEPSDSTVQGCANTFSETDGDIRQVVRFLITSNEFKSPATIHNKVKTPLEFVIAFNRAFDFENRHPSGLDTLKSDISGSMNADLNLMHMPLYRMPAPTGYAEIAKKWVNSDQLKARVRFQNKLILNRDFNPLALVKGLGLNNAEQIVDYFLILLLDNDFQAKERQIALNILTQNGQQAFDVNTLDDTDLRSMDMKILRMTLATIASFPTHQLQ